MYCGSVSIEVLHLQGLGWSSFPVDSHQFPKLRLKFKQNLISLAGGMTRLPVTDPKAGPYQPSPHMLLPGLTCT